MKTEVMPQFPDGSKGMYEFFEKHSKLQISKEPFSSAKNVIAEVVIDSIGNVVYANILQGIGDNYNNDVIEVIKKMPPWKPAHQNGKAVPILLTIPVTFKQ